MVYPLCSSVQKTRKLMTNRVSTLNSHNSVETCSLMIISVRSQDLWMEFLKLSMKMITVSKTQELITPHWNLRMWCWIIGRQISRWEIWTNSRKQWNYLPQTKLKHSKIQVQLKKARCKPTNKTWFKLQVIWGTLEMEPQKVPHLPLINSIMRLKCAIEVIS
jgi:hypothetical protein